MTKIQPIGDRIIAIKRKSEEVRESGIIVPTIFDANEHDEAEVVAVGPGRYDGNGDRVPMQTKVGDRIVFNKWQVQPIRLPNDPQDYIALRDDDVRAVLDQ